jgi:hypothetical protein
MNPRGGAFAGRYPDLNNDGFANSDDIQPFVQGLLGPDDISATPRRCKIAAYDINGDGSVDGLDIQGFVALRVGG